MDAAWAVGLLGGLFLLVVGWLWNLNRDLTKSMADLKAKVDTNMNALDQRVTAQETKMGPLWKLCEEALPVILKIHASPDLLREALDGDPDIEKIDKADVEVTRRQLADSDPNTQFQLMFARWMLVVRRAEYKELSRKVNEAGMVPAEHVSWWKRFIGDRDIGCRQ